MIASLVLADGLRAQIAQEARAAFPRECCGLIEGTRDGTHIIATALHPARNIATEADRFEIDPSAHIALLKKLRGTDRSIVGCYHSHPRGFSEPSVRDREAAAEEGFLWLVQAEKLSGFVWGGGDFSQVALIAPALA